MTDGLIPFPTGKAGKGVRYRLGRLSDAAGPGLVDVDGLCACGNIAPPKAYLPFDSTTGRVACPRCTSTNAPGLSEIATALDTLLHELQAADRGRADALDRRLTELLHATQAHLPYPASGAIRWGDRPAVDRG